MFLSQQMRLLTGAVLGLSLVGVAVAQDGPTTKPYTLTTCLVSGEKLGSMGDPVVLVHQGREVKLCCSHCEPQFKADPAKFIKKLDEAPTTKPAS